MSRGIVNFFDFVGAAGAWRARLSGWNESVAHAPSGESGNAAYASRLMGLFGEGWNAEVRIMFFSSGVRAALTWEIVWR